MANYLWTRWLHGVRKKSFLEVMVKVLVFTGWVVMDLLQVLVIFCSNNRLAQASMAVVMSHGEAERSKSK